MALSYHESATSTVTRTRRRRSGGPLPLRVYLVLKWLRTVLNPGQPASISNAAVAEGVGYKSEGEVSQILRWLAGDLPTTGRWAHRYLDQAQQLRYLRRERRPDGGYSTTLLATPEPLVIADAEPAHDPSDDPSSAAPDSGMIPPPMHDPSGESCSEASEGGKPRIERDHAIQQDSNQGVQEEESARAPEASIEQNPLEERLMAEPRMRRSVARRVVARALGDLAAFEYDVGLAQITPGATDPFFFTVARWLDGQRVVPPQEQAHERSDDIRSARAGAGRQPHAHQSQRSPGRSGRYAHLDQAHPNLDAEYERRRAEYARRAEERASGGLPAL